MLSPWPRAASGSSCASWLRPFWFIDVVMGMFLHYSNCRWIQHGLRSDAELFGFVALTCRCFIMHLAMYAKCLKTMIEPSGHNHVWTKPLKQIPLRLGWYPYLTRLVQKLVAFNCLRPSCVLFQGLPGCTRQTGLASRNRGSAETDGWTIQRDDHQNPAVGKKLGLGPCLVGSGVKASRHDRALPPDQPPNIKALHPFGVPAITAWQRFKVPTPESTFCCSEQPHAHLHPVHSVSSYRSELFFSSEH